MPVMEREDVRRKSGARDWVASLLLHGLVFGGILGAGLWSNRHHERFGDAVEKQGAVQATMVSSLPLPPRVKPQEDNVLASETPSVVPPPKVEKAEPPPEPKAVPVPDKKPVLPPKRPHPRRFIRHRRLWCLRRIRRQTGWQVGRRVAYALPCSRSKRRWARARST